MRKYLVMMLLVLSTVMAMGQGRKMIQISDIRRSGSWYYIYDQNGRRQKTFSASIGELVGFSSEFYILRSGSWYHLYDSGARQYKTLSVSSTGVILNVTGNVFVAQRGSWISTYDKNGKRLSTRSAR